MDKKKKISAKPRAASTMPLSPRGAACTKKNNNAAAIAEEIYSHLDALLDKKLAPIVELLEEMSVALEILKFENVDAKGLPRGAGRPATPFTIDPGDEMTPPKLKPDEECDPYLEYEKYFGETKESQIRSGLKYYERVANSIADKKKRTVPAAVEFLSATQNKTLDGLANVLINFPRAVDTDSGCIYFGPLLFLDSPGIDVKTPLSVLDRGRYLEDLTKQARAPFDRIVEEAGKYLSDLAKKFPGAKKELEKTIAKLESLVRVLEENEDDRRGRISAGKRAYLAAATEARLALENIDPDFLFVEAVKALRAGSMTTHCRRLTILEAIKECINNGYRGSFDTKLKLDSIRKTLQDHGYRFS